MTDAGKKEAELVQSPQSTKEVTADDQSRYPLNMSSGPEVTIVGTVVVIKR